MQLLIKNNHVISYYRDEQIIDPPEGTELVSWHGPTLDLLEDDTDPRSDEQKLADAKTRKLQELTTWDAERRQAGVPFGSHTLKSAEYDQRRLSTLLTAVNESLSQEVMTVSDVVSIWDSEGTKQNITVADFKAAVPVYTYWCQYQEEEIGELTERINNAQTQEELNTITW